VPQPATLLIRQVVPRPVLLCLALVAACGAIAIAPGPAEAAPFPSFVWGPTGPLSNQPVLFASTSTTIFDRNLSSQIWDLNGDGEFGDASGATVTWSFPTPGTYKVSLRVRDDRGDQADITEMVPVGNAPPVASILASPGSPHAGELVTFFSTSTDPNDRIVSQAWDLDGDDKFDDGTEPVASRTFPTAGTYKVQLSVVDNDGASSVATTTVVVGEPVQALATPLLSPFPVVRISGVVKGEGIKLRLLTINAPVGATLTISCRGKGCPFRTYRRELNSIRRGSSKEPGLTRSIRIRHFRRKLLLAGAKVQVFITKGGAIGKYTRFKVRKKRPPARLDRCLVPRTKTPVPCPPL
jgi:PKD repeat protein